MQKFVLFIVDIIRRVRKIVQSDCYLHVSPSVCPHGTTRLLLDGFSWNFIAEYFSKICRENSSSMKFWPELRVLYMTTIVYLWQNLAELFYFFASSFTEHAAVAIQPTPVSDRWVTTSNPHLDRAYPSSVPPDKWRDNASFRPQQTPAKSFRTQQSPVIIPSDATYIAWDIYRVVK